MKKIECYVVADYKERIARLSQIPVVILKLKDRKTPMFEKRVTITIKEDKCHSVNWSS